MANDPSFEASAPTDSLGFEEAPIELPARSAPASTPPSAPAKKFVDVYTTMLFVAAIFLLVGTLALAWEKQKFGDLFGNTWKIPPNFKTSAIEKPGAFDTDRFFRV